MLEKKVEMQNQAQKAPGDGLDRSLAIGDLYNALLQSFAEAVSEQVELLGAHQKNCVARRLTQWRQAGTRAGF
jgi:hypothetical protein